MLELDSSPHLKWLMSTLGFFALPGAARDLGLVPLSWMPQPIRQLPRQWMAVLGPYKASALWGLHVGIGRRTRVGYALYYFLVMWVVLRGTPIVGALVLATYGLAHGLLLSLEITGIAYHRLDRLDGLLGMDRSDFLFRFSGISLLASGIFLLARATMS
jgi:hypothetical protein